MTSKIIHFDSINSVNNPTTIIDPVTTTLKSLNSLIVLIS